MGAANGGQIVCSAATVALCRDVSFRDAGMHVLAGVGNERLFVVTGIGDGEHHPLRSTTTVLTNLIRPSSRLVGRDEELRRVIEALGAHRMVTLVGPGGVGKTRLATETALEVTPRFPDGVWFCELAAVGQGDAVPAAVADTIGARHQAGMDLTEAIAAYLQRRRSLVVLDNCEHVLDAVVQLARRLLALEGVVVLATSREALRLEGEQRWPVPPLPESAAMDLFADRCRERDPDFSLDAAATEAVREISRRVDGIPLALELAAGRTTALSPQVIAERLKDRFRVLRGGRPGQRHQTLRDTVQWSYELLTPPEAALFDRLCVFVGGFTVETAEAVCADDALVDELDVLDLLVALVDKSMVQHDKARDRFVMLETLRQFGEEQLQTRNEATTYRDRHASFYRDLAIELDRRAFGPAEADVWARFEAEWDNLRVAFTHLRQQGDLPAAADIVLASYFYAAMALRFEVGDWAAEVLTRPTGLPPATVSRLRGVRSWAAWFTGDNAFAVELFDTAARDGTIEPTFYYATILSYLSLDDLTRVAGAAGALRVAARAEDPRDCFFAALAQPYALTAAGDIDGAVAWANKSLRIATAAGSPSAAAHELQARGIAQSGNLALALADARRALELASSVHATHAVADGALGRLAWITAQGDDLAEALRYAREAVFSSWSAHYPGGLYGSLQAATVVLARLGDTLASERLLRTYRSSGYRISRRVERAVVEALGRPIRTEPDDEPLTMLDAARFALDSIDSHLSELSGATPDGDRSQHRS